MLKPEKIREAGIILTRVVSKSHSGPIPSAEELEHLERVRPGLADRVVAMAENEQTYRHDMSSKIVDKEFALRGRGQLLLIPLLMPLFALIAYIAYLGDTKAAVALGSVTIISLATLLYSGKYLETAADDRDAGEEQKPAPKLKRKVIPNRTNNRRKK